MGYFEASTQGGPKGRHPVAVRAWRWTIWVLALSGLALGNAFGLPGPVDAGERIKAFVVVRDTLTSPGNPGRLEALVFEEGLLGRRVGLGGETVEFFVQGALVGRAMTGGDGRAFLEYVPRMRGNLSVTARVQESSRIDSAEGTGLLASWERKRPILLVDVMALSPASSPPKISLPSLPMKLRAPLPETIDEAAPAELEKLSRFYYNLIYLYRGEGGDRDRLQTWLRTHGFPAGFPQILEDGGEALGEYLDQMKAAGWDNIAGGIGRTKDFATVLAERRLKVVVLQPSEDAEGFPRRTILVDSWKVVRKHL